MAEGVKVAQDRHDQDHKALCSVALGVVSPLPLHPVFSERAQAWEHFAVLYSVGCHLACNHIIEMTNRKSLGHSLF